MPKPQPEGAYKPWHWSSMGKANECEWLMVRAMQGYSGVSLWTGKRFPYSPRPFRGIAFVRAWYACNTWTVVDRIEHEELMGRKVGRRLRGRYVRRMVKWLNEEVDRNCTLTRG